MAPAQLGSAINMPAQRNPINRKPAPDQEPKPQRTNVELDQLLAHVKIAHRAAGEPSYRTIATLAKPRLSPSTISRIFRATNPPKWANLAALLTALGVAEAELAAVWHPMWAKAVNAVNPIAESTDTPAESLGRPSLPDPSTLLDKTCAKCGVSVVNPGQHAKWHERLSRAEDLLEALDRNSKRSPLLTTPRTGNPPRSRVRDGQHPPTGTGTGTGTTS